MSWESDPPAEEWCRFCEGGIADDHTECRWAARYAEQDRQAVLEAAAMAKAGVLLGLDDDER